MGIDWENILDTIISILEKRKECMSVMELCKINIEYCDKKLKHCNKEALKARLNSPEHRKWVKRQYNEVSALIKAQNILKELEDTLLMVYVNYKIKGG